MNTKAHVFEIQIISDYIHRQYGLVVQDHQYHLLENFMHQLVSSPDYIDINSYIEKIQNSNSVDKHIKDLLDTITVDESYFFRHKDHVEFLSECFFPELIKEKRVKNDLSISVWSAGCASGQEPYTIAMILKSLLPDIQKWDIKILGTDINFRALQRASNAIYKNYSFRVMLQDEINENFTYDKQSESYALADDLKKYVRFSYHNLCDRYYLDGISDESEQHDLILCRNVFIYLDYDMVLRIVSRFNKQLNDAGVMILGPSDIIKDQLKEFSIERYENVIFYRKNIINYTEDKKDSNDFEEFISVNENNINDFSIQIKEELIESSEAINSEEDWLSLKVKLLNEMKVQGESDYLWYKLAQTYANLGHYDLAKEAIKKSVDLNEFNASTYLLKGIIEYDERDYSNSYQSLKKSIYIDECLLEAYFYLSHILVENNQYEEAKKYLEKAMNIGMKGKLIDVPDDKIAEFITMMDEELTLLNKLRDVGNG